VQDSEDDDWSEGLFDLSGKVRLRTFGLPDCGTLGLWDFRTFGLLEEIADEHQEKVDVLDA